MPAHGQCLMMSGVGLIDYGQFIYFLFKLTGARTHSVPSFAKQIESQFLCFVSSLLFSSHYILVARVFRVRRRETGQVQVQVTRHRTHPHA